jgi:hypothetical protein
MLSITLTPAPGLQAREPRKARCATVSWTFLFAVATLVGVTSAYAGDKEVRVTVLARHVFTNEYEYGVPGSAVAKTKGDTTCRTVFNRTRCSDESETTVTATAPSTVQRTFQGASLVLHAPDGRVAVVRCVDKYSFDGDGINTRSCRIPPMNEFTAEFSGQNAKLRWRVGWDEKKTTSETYSLEQVLTREEWVSRARERAREDGWEILDTATQ